MDRYSRAREVFLIIVLSTVLGGSCLMFLFVITSGAVMVPVVGFAIIGLFAMVHYLLWGRSMDEQVAGEREAAQEEEQQQTLPDQWPPDGPHGRNRF